jgi:hypothetical protein
MQRCLTCRSVYDDAQQFCEKDGSPLLAFTDLTPNQQFQKAKDGIAKRGIAVISAVIVIAVFAIGIVYFVNRQPAPPAPEKTSTPSPGRRDEIRQPAGDPAPQPSKSRPGYFVIGLSSREQADAVQEMERRNQAGHQTHVAYSSEWSDLSPGFYVVVYGVFDAMADATAAANELKSRGVQVYVKYSGSAITDGLAPTPGQETGRLNADPVSAADPVRKAAVGQSGGGGEEAISEVMKLWDQHFTKCGDSYVSLGSNNSLRQLRGVSFVVSRRHTLTKADGLKGYEWTGQVKAQWSVWRRANRHDSGWVWGDWKDTPQSFTFDVSKRNSRWKVLNPLYDQKQVECPDLP